MKNQINFKYIKNILAYIFIALLLELLVLGNTNITVCLVTILLCAITAIIPVMLEKKGLISSSHSFNWKNWKSILPCLLFWFLLVCIRIPIELYMNNLGDFQFVFWYYVMVLILGSVISIVVIYALCVLLLNQRQVDFLGTTIFAISIMGYLQEMVLNRNLDVLKGDEQVWDTRISIVNMIIWIIGILAIFFVRYRWKKIKKIYYYLTIYICLVQIVTTIFLVVTGDTNNQAAFKAFTKEGSLELSEQDNIIVFLLDRCDTSFIYEIEKESPDFFEPLHDFTFYPNNTCEFANTFRALPFILTGTQWEAETIENYPIYAYENSDFLQVVHDSGYEMNIFTEEDYVEEPYRKDIANYNDDTKQKCRALDTFQQLMVCSKYRIAPIKMKNMFKYGAGNIDWLIDNSFSWSTNNDYPFYCSLVNDGLKIRKESKGKGTFYLYHFWGSHTPTNWSENMEPVSLDAVTPEEQTKAAFKMLYEYMNQMKKLEKYKDATIIITADHGMQFSEKYFLENGELDRTTIPVLFVKHANDEHEKMVVNEAPVSQRELIPTILSVMDVEHLKYGKTFDEIELNETRKRFFLSEIGLLFEIDGDARKKENWKMVERVYGE